MLYTIFFSLLALALGYVIALIISKNQVSTIKQDHINQEKAWADQKAQLLSSQPLLEERLRHTEEDLAKAINQSKEYEAETKRLQEVITQQTVELATCKSRNEALNTLLAQQKAEADKTVQELNDQIETLTQKSDKLQAINLQQTADITKTQSENNYLKTQLATQKEELEKMQKQLLEQFENISSRVLKARTEEFNDVSERNLKTLLTPFNATIEELKKRIAENQQAFTTESSKLSEQVRLLNAENRRISEEANNLTKALKGDVKRQGNWGECILEQLIENTGMQKGIEYEREKVLRAEDGSIQRLDVLLHLPNKRQIIIDSKVSLIAYDKANNATNEEERQAALKEHIESVKRHINILHEKEYYKLPDLNTLDFVVLFIPIESSFAMAAQGGTELFDYAWGKQIILASPTNLLAILYTISNLWKQEKRNMNALEIAHLSGSLYDKLVGFVNDWEKVAEHIRKANDSYNSAMNKMHEGRGNVFITAQKLKKMGAKASKALPPSVINDMDDDDVIDSEPLVLND